MKCSTCVPCFLLSLYILIALLMRFHSFLSTVLLCLHCYYLWENQGSKRLNILPSITELAQAVEKAMAPHSSTLAWKIPWTEEPGRLQSMELRRVRHDWATLFSLSTFMHWRRKWQPTPVFLPGESQGWRSLVGCRLWGRIESDKTEAT